MFIAPFSSYQLVDTAVVVVVVMQMKVEVMVSDCSVNLLRITVMQTSSPRVQHHLGRRRDRLPHHAHRE